MTITVEWADDEKTICVMRREVGWTWAEFDAGTAKSARMIKDVDHQVDLIVEGGDEMPPGFPVSHFLRARRAQPDNVRQVIIVVVNPYGRSIFNAISRLNNFRSGKMVAASTTEEAMALAIAPV